MSDDKTKPVLPRRMSGIVVPPDPGRLTTNISGLDVCLAETDDGPQGVPDGTSILLSGMPGGGKSTIATFVSSVKDGEGEVLILHGEERAESVRKRWDRFGLTGDPWLYPLKRCEDALEVIRDLSLERPLRRVVIDSIQCLSLGNKRRYDDQLEAVEMLTGQICSAGGTAIFISHVSKTGKDHAGAAGLAHLVDMHLHVTTNAKRAERMLEVRKNRHGRAGFEVPISIGISSMNIGTPAPLANGSMSGARSGLEKAVEMAMELLLKGERIDGYDFDKAGVNGGLWRAGMDVAVKRLTADGYEVIEDKVKQRRGYRLLNPPASEPKAVPALDMKAKEAPKATTDDAEPMTPTDPLHLDMD